MSKVVSTQRFKNARWQATVSSIFATITQKDDKLTSLNEILSLTKSKNTRYLGSQTILVENIIGSEGRYEDFNKNFLPLNDDLRERWATIDELHEKQVHLPPISVYKIDDYYFVRDGHHRVSVAKSRKQEYIDAEVVEYMVNVPITKELTAKHKMIIQEHTNFLEETQLDKYQGAEIRLTQPASYRVMMNIIRHYTEWHNTLNQTQMTFQEGAIDWYRRVFTPFAEDVYRNDILDEFPNRTTGDLYVWLQLNWVYMKDKVNGTMQYLNAAETGESIDEEQAKQVKDRNFERHLLRIIHDRREQVRYEPITMAVSGVLLYINEQGVIQIVVVKRKYHPFEGHWALPIAMLRSEETRTACATRCFEHVLGITSPIKVVNFQTFDEVDRTPWGRVISFGMLGIYYGENVRLSAGGVASEIQLVDLDKVPKLTFDHNEIVLNAYKYLYSIRNNFSFIKELFPDEIPLKYIINLLAKIRQIKQDHDELT